MLQCGAESCRELQRVAKCWRVLQRVAVRGMETKRFKQARAVTCMAHPLRLRVSVSFGLWLCVFMSVFVCVYVCVCEHTNTPLESCVCVCM